MSLQLTRHQAWMDGQALSEPQDTFFLEEGCHPSDETMQLVLLDTKLRRGAVGELFFLVDMVSRLRLDFLIQDVLIVSVALQDMLQLVAQHEPEVVDPIQAQRHRDHGLLIGQPKAGSIDLAAGNRLHDHEAHATLVQDARHVSGFLRRRAQCRHRGSRGEIRAQRAEYRLPRALQSANPLATLRANLRLSSPACRHAVRCSVCIAIALGLSHLLPLSRGYWLPMTVAIVLRADFGATWRIGLLRVLGTLGGLFLTTAVLHFGGVGNFWVALALMAVLCFGFRELAAVHYGIAVVCLTGMVVILLSFYGVPAAASVQARTIETALGSALALLAYLVWPTWERGRERGALAQMLDAYRDYLAAVLHGDARARRETRVAARAARSSAQASLDRLRTEPASRINLPRAEALVAQANRLIRAAMTLEAARGSADMPSSPELDAFAQACDAALRECATALREARLPQGDWPLRKLQRALAEPLAKRDDALGASLLDAGDRVVDAIDSMLHVLAEARSPNP